MYTDLPKCLKCCFCLPLRYSLAAWGYLKIITSLISLGLLLWVFFILYFGFRYNGPILIMSILIALISVDTAFDIVLIVAAHKKNVKLFQCYYYYSVVVLVLFVIVMTTLIGYQITFLFSGQHRMYSLGGTIETIFLGLGIILAQVYITFLVRTEMVKLRDNCKFEFVNNAAESQCTVHVGIYPETNQETTQIEII